MFGADPLSFATDGADWPLRAFSRFVDAGGCRWHVQELGEGPLLLLIHGTGAATHSWRDLAPLLARRFRVLSLDLPGHAFTRPLGRLDLSLRGMTRTLAKLLGAIGAEPSVVVGHSAGAAILAQMVLDQSLSPKMFVSINGAFWPFDGFAAPLFSAAAKLLFLNPLAPRVFAWAADRTSVDKLMRGTGSNIDARGIDLYTRLFGNPVHVAGTLGMMANWRLDGLERKLAVLRGQTLFLVGAGDLAVPPGSAKRLAATVAGSTFVSVSAAGHLVHEEKPIAVERAILESFDGRP